MARRSTRKRKSETEAVPEVTPSEVDKKEEEEEYGNMNGHATQKNIEDDEYKAALTDPRKAYEVHRCRFVEASPNGITSVSISRSGKYVAVARQNGNIDIWATDGWLCLKTIFGNGEGGIRFLSWLSTQDVNGIERERLISTGLNGSIVEWDLHSLTVKTVSDSYGGAVWGAAMNHSDTLLAIACEDGSIRLFDISQAGQINYLRAIGHHEGAALSVAFSLDDKHLASGGSDCTIRLWDIEENSNLQRMVVETYGTNRVCVWTMSYVAGNMLVTGDSLGRTQFWDTKMGILSQSFKKHQADVVTMVSTREGTQVFSSGIDSSVSLFSLIPNKDGEQKWVLTVSQRSSNSDVNTLSLGDINQISFLISGGSDGRLVVYNAMKFKSRSPIRLSPFSVRKTVSVSSEHRRIAYQEDRSISVYKLGTKPKAFQYDIDLKTLPTGERLPVDVSYKNLLKLSVKSQLNLSTGSMSPNGKWIIASDPLSTRLFSVSFSEMANADRLTVKKIKSLSLPPSNVAVFSSDSSLLFLGTFSSTVVVFSLASLSVLRTIPFPSGLSSSSTSESKEKQEEEEEDEDDISDCERGISYLSVSSDGSKIAAGNSTKVCLFAVDTGVPLSLLPRMESRISALSFHPSGDALVVATTSNHVYIFNIKEKRFSDWNKDVASKYPYNIARLRENIFNITFDTTRPSLILLHSHSYIVMLDLSKKVPTAEEIAALAPTHTRTSGSYKKVKLTPEERLKFKNAKEKIENFRVITLYQQMLHVECIGSDSILVVEIPWIKYLESVPEPLFRVKYGS